MICPVCKKEIDRPLHITKSKDEAHKKFVEEQLKIGEKLLFEGMPITHIRNEESIIVVGAVEDYLYRNFKNKVQENAKKSRSKNISKAMSKEDSVRKKVREKINIAINNGIEGIDYVECRVCGLKSTNISQHVIRIHKLSSKEYKIKYPGAEMFSLTLRNKYKENMIKNNPNEIKQAIEKMKNTKASTKDERVRKAKEQFASGERVASRNTGRGVGGYRDDLGHYCRSMWEANVARVLKFKNILYQFEPKVFAFYDENGELIDSYLPDFYLPNSNTWLEVKGQMNETSKRKLELMKEHYPNEKIFIVETDTYGKMMKFLSHNNVIWEYGKKNIKTHSQLFKGE